MTRGLFVLALALLGGGCTGQIREAAPPAKGESAPGRKPLTEIDALEHDLSVSEQRLEAQLVRREQALSDSRSGEGEPDASKKTESSSLPPAQKPAEEEKPRPRDEAPQPSAPPPPGDAPVRTGTGSPCDMACRALSSMRRSADRICELAGAADERCTRARARLSAAAERIRRAQCECANGGGSEKLNASL